MEFFSELSSFLRANSGEIREGLILSKSNPLFQFYDQRMSSYLHPLPEPQKPKMEVCATDGSEFVQELYSGKKFIVARALAQAGQRQYETSFFGVMAMDRDDVQQLVKRIMENEEHKAAMKAMEHEKNCLMFMDGSLPGRFYWGKKRYEGDIGVDFRERYMDQMVSMLQWAMENNVVMVYISKTSETSALRKEILKGESSIPDFAKTNQPTDHVLIKSLARFPCYSEPLDLQGEYGGKVLKFRSMHVLPSMEDLPMKVDFMIPENSPVDVKDILSWIMWGYSGIRSHNIWASLVDRSVKLDRDTTRIVKEMFENEIEVWNAETRGQRRERIRI